MDFLKSFSFPLYEGEENKEVENKEVENKEVENKEQLLTQDQFNKALAEDRRKHKEQTQKLINDLEVLKKSKNLSDQEKNALNTRIEELQTQVMTKEQLLEKEKSRLQNEHQTELHREKSEKEIWKSRYTEATIIRSITDAAVTADAFSPDQIVALLQNNTRLVEETNDENQGTGVFTPRVKFKDTDSDGKPTVLDLSVQEAIKRMKDLPEKYGNLFKSNITGGIGGTGSQTSKTPVDFRKIKSFDDYKKIKDRIFK